MNADVKILAKALAIRLEKILPTIISEEQDGLIEGCQLFYNVCTLLNAIFSRNSSPLPEVIANRC